MSKSLQPLSIKDLRRFEGRPIKFLGDSEQMPRHGIITDIMVDEPSKDCLSGVHAVVLWDTDETLAIENGIKTIICDTGVSIFPLVRLVNKERYHIS